MMSWPLKLEMPMERARPCCWTFSMACQVSWMVALPGMIFSPS